MKTIGFIDYYIDEWHANEYPGFIKAYNEKNGTDYQVKYVWAEIDKEGGVSTDDWCKKYGAEKHAYIMSGQDKVLERLQKEYPDIIRCCGAGDGKWEIVDRAIKYGCSKVQLFKEYYTKEMINKAHENGIVCNYFFCDKAESTENMLDMGADVILTNDYNRISQIVNKRQKYEM